MQNKVALIEPKELTLVLACNDDFAIDKLCTRNATAPSANLAKALGQATLQQLSAHARLADKRAQTTSLYQKTCRTQILDRAPHRNTAHGVLGRQLRLGWDLIPRSIYTVIDSIFDLVVYLLIQRHLKLAHDVHTPHSAAARLPLACSIIQGHKVIVSAKGI